MATQTGDSSYVNDSVLADSLTGSPSAGGANTSWDTWLAQHKSFQTYMQGLYGDEDPFAPGGTVDRPGQSNIGHDASTISAGGWASDMDPQFVYDLISTMDKYDVEYDPASLQKLATEYWGNSEIQGGYEGGVKTMDSLIAAELKDGNLVQKTRASTKKQYASIAEEVADMSPLARARYQREEAKAAQEQFQQRYQGIYDLVSKYFGWGPMQVSHQQILDIAAHGNDAGAWENYIRTLPSHIAGIPIGQYSDLKALADQQSQSTYGMVSNDTVIKALHDQGLHSKSDVQFYYEQLPFQPGDTGYGKVDPNIFNQVYSAASQWTKRIWNQEPHPLDLQHLFQKAGGDATAAVAGAGHIIGQDWQQSQSVRPLPAGALDPHKEQMETGPAAQTA